jgi:glutathione S-transferase
MAKPVLWQIKVSHYSEKVRWALDYKGVEHERKAPSPPAHMAVALAKTRGKAKTFPLLDLDGRTYGDSTEIIAALEERFPEPALYPSDPDERRRALELEEFFDEQVGPYTRRLAWHELVRDRDALARMIESGAVGSVPGGARGAPVMAGFLNLRFKVKSPAGAEEARTKILAGFDRLEAELDGGEYLVGDSFTVADLTAASLLYPVVSPEEGPQLPEPPPAYARFRDPLSERPGFRWVAETFRRHRSRGKAKTAVAA